MEGDGTMIHESLTIDGVIEFLNGCLEEDRPALTRMMLARTVCTEGLALHPTTQVGEAAVLAGDCGRWRYHIGPLGLLNGMFGIDDDGWGAITAIFKDDGSELIRFERTTDAHKGRESSE